MRTLIPSMCFCVAFVYIIILIFTLHRSQHNRTLFDRVAEMIDYIVRVYPSDSFYICVV